MAANRIGIPPGALVLGTASWLLMLVLWAAHQLGGGFAVFLGAVLTAAIAVGISIVSTTRQAGLLEALAPAVLLVLAGAVPIVFDPHTADVFNLPRYTLVVVGALALAGLAAVRAVHERRAPTWRVGLQWPIAAVVVWAVVATLASRDVNVSLLGNYGSYDGLYAKLAFATIALSAAGIAGALVTRVLRALAFAGGGVVVLYGLIQLHDTELGGHLWDFVRWHDTSFSNQIFATFGNPNHLAGYLSIILPTIVVLGLQARRRWLQVAAVVFGLATLLEILRSAARGAWVAVIASAVVLLLAVLPELRRRPALSFGALGGLLVVVAAGMAALGHKLLHVPLSSLFQSGGTSPVEQRFQIWQQAVHMAANRPATGMGPDTFALVYPQYQSAAWVKGLGPNYIVNGAHDLFMNLLADQGWLGLILFLVLLAFVGLRSVGAWRRLRQVERSETAGVDATGRARRERLVLAAIVAGIVAYVVQAMFNVQQIGLSFCFWLLVGLLAAVTCAAGVPDTLRPGRLVAASPSGADDAAESTTNSQPSHRPSGRRQPARGFPWVTALAAAGAAAVVVVLSLGADGPWRADHAFWAASVESQAAVQAATHASGASQQVVAQDSSAYITDMKSAMTLNPWEPQYPASEGSVFVNTAAHASGTLARQDLVQAHRLYLTALADEPLVGSNAESLASVDLQLARLDAAAKASYLRQAVTAARQALQDNPRDASYQQFLHTVRTDEATGTSKG